jgi:hypothetical protein
MKNLAIIAAVFTFILLLTKIADQAPRPKPSGLAFWLYAQQVVECSPDDVTFVDVRHAETHLEKDDSSWPSCARFHKDDILDFYLSRGEKTHYMRDEPTVWWRKAMR